MTIGNLSSKIRQKPSMHRVVLVALLPIPSKQLNNLQKWLDQLCHRNREVLNDVLWRVLQPLVVQYNPGAESGYYLVLCADGNSWNWKPVVAAWLADCPECRNLHHPKCHACFWCECSKNELGEYVPPEM
jgi:hypothetical protein